MTPLSLVYDIRLRVDDTGGDTGTPSAGFTYYWEENEAGTLWKNTEIIQYLNTAHREIALRTQCYRDGGESEICQISVKVGTASYDIDSRIMTIEDVLLNSTGTSLTKTHLTDYRRIEDHRTTTGTPTHYLEENRPFKITLYPVPIVADKLYLTVYRYPLNDMTWTARKANIEGPPDSLREALIQGALMYAYQKRDADTSDVNHQKFHAREFEKLVGPPVDYKTLETRRYNANLDVSVIAKGYVPRVKGTRRWYNDE